MRWPFIPFFVRVEFWVLVLLIVWFGMGTSGVTVSSPRVDAVPNEYQEKYEEGAGEVLDDFPPATHSTFCQRYRIRRSVPAPRGSLPASEKFIKLSHIVSWYPMTVLYSWFVEKISSSLLVKPWRLYCLKIRSYINLLLRNGYLVGWPWTQTRVVAHMVTWSCYNFKLNWWI